MAARALTFKWLMIKPISDYLTFFGEFRRAFRTTGALAPSGRGLARCVCKPLAQHSGPCRILEVGSGTGAVTREIVRVVDADMQLDLVELNERFVSYLQGRFEREPAFQRVSAQTTIFAQPVEELEAEPVYDFIISGLPFNNFAPEDVKQILRHLVRLLKPNGTLSFFEYLWIRRAKSVFSRHDERRRLGGVGCVVNWFVDRYQIREHKVFSNLPPALVHHLQCVPQTSETREELNGAVTSG